MYADQVWDKRRVCEFFGGTRPIDPSTLYRGIKAGRYPPPFHVGPGSSRWIPAECIAAREALISARGSAPHATVGSSRHKSISCGM
jgi:predicted DNA-binding transcriptional regulator AlpA